jgi:hypothetical protein
MPAVVSNAWRQVSAGWLPAEGEPCVCWVTRPGFAHPRWVRAIWQSRGWVDAEYGSPVVGVVTHWMTPEPPQ